MDETKAERLHDLHVELADAEGEYTEHQKRLDDLSEEIAEIQREIAAVRAL